MKKTILKILCMMLVAVMLTASFAACDPADPVVTTEPDQSTQDPGVDQTTAEETTEEETTEEETTKEETTEETTVPTPVPAEGLLVYRQEFDTPNLSGDTALVLQNIGWTRLTVDGDGVYNETNANFSIVDGRLYFENYGDGYDGKDGYYQIDMLNDEYMKQVCAGKYTLQYDLEYVDAGASDRYAVLTTEASSDGLCYNSFHLRVRAYANHQCHWVDKGWKTYNSMPSTTDGSIPSLCEKILGVPYDETQMALLNKKITIKLQWDPADENGGHTVYVKVGDGDFVLVSQPDPDSTGSVYHKSWDGWNVRFKIGAKINGYIDNIVLWTGWGDMPTATTPDYAPVAE